MKIVLVGIWIFKGALKQGFFFISVLFSDFPLFLPPRCPVWAFPAPDKKVSPTFAEPALSGVFLV
jgi:hypothetical protein